MILLLAPNYKTYFISFALLIFVIGGASAQRQIIELASHTTDINIGKQTYYLEDQNNTLNPAAILAGQHDAQFQLHDADYFTFGNVNTTYWHRFTISDNAQKSTTWYLIIDNHHIDTISFYLPNDLGRYQDEPISYTTEKSGRLTPYDSRSVEFNMFAFKIPNIAGETQDYYFKLSSTHMNYPLKIMSETEFYKQRSQRKFLFGIVLGFLLMIALYNLFIFFTVRDISYLLFICYVFLMTIGINNIYGNADHLFQGRLFFLNYHTPIIIMLPGIAGYLFAYYFLNLKKHLPWALKFILFVLVPAWLLLIYFDLSNMKMQASMVNQFGALVAIPFLLLCGILTYRKGYKPARFYVVAEVCILIVYLAYATASLGIIPFNTKIEYAFVIGAALEILFFSFALADKINVYKKERQLAEKELLLSLQKNEKLIKDQNKVLEDRVKERTQDLQREKENSEKLLLNILPAEIAEELKINGKTKAKSYEHSTIIFTDFVNFTGISADMDPIALVQEVNKCFTAFDHITEKHHLEKIKTIGDAYLAVCGLPTANPKHAENVVNAAFEIRDFITNHNAESGLFQIRIGIHTGPLVAGVVGVKKFAFDIWGNAVNIASRMESESESGQINISETTYAIVKDICHCTYKGTISTKDRDEIKMYYIEQKKTEATQT